MQLEYVSKVPRGLGHDVPGVSGESVGKSTPPEPRFTIDNEGHGWQTGFVVNLDEDSDLVHTLQEAARQGRKRQYGGPEAERLARANKTSPVKAEGGITRLTIIAHEINLNTKLEMQSCTVSLHALILNIGDHGKIWTNGKSMDHADAALAAKAGEYGTKETKTGGMSYTYPAPGAGSDGENGFDGDPAGSIYIYGNDVKFPKDPADDMFCTNGGHGQSPGEGVKGVDGNIAEGWSYAKDEKGDYPHKLTSEIRNGDLDDYIKPWSSRPYESWIKFGVYSTVIDYTVAGSSVHARNHQFKAEPYPDDGGDALQKAGRPGSGGKAGHLVLSYYPHLYHKEFKARFQAKGGNSAKPIDTPGGAAGYGYHPGDASQAPAKMYEISVHNTDWKIKTSRGEITWEEVTLKDGAPLKGPKAEHPDGGSDGSVQESRWHAEWFHPLHVGLYQDRLNALFMNDETEELNSLVHRLKDRLSYLKEFMGKARDEGWPKYAYSAEMQGYLEIAYSSVVNVLQTVNAISLRQDQGLDYFGNPSGWSPSLSLPVLLKHHDDAVDHALRGLYVAQWFEKTSVDQQAAMQMHWHAIETIREERRKDLQRYASLMKIRHAFQDQMAAMRKMKADLEKPLQKRINELKEDAKRRVIAQHAFDLLGSVLEVIPVYQPALGAAGKAIKIGASYATKPNASKADVWGQVAKKSLELGQYGLKKMAEPHSKEAADLEKQAEAKDKEKFYGRLRGQKQKAFDEAKAADAKKLRSAAKVPREKAKQWTDTAGRLSEATSDIVGDIQSLVSPGEEIDALLAQLEAGDPTYKRLTTRIQTLNQMKIALYTMAHQMLEMANHLTAQIAQGHLSEADALESMLEAQKGKLSEKTLTIAKQLSTRSMKELLQARYWVVRGYENLFLEPFPGDTHGGPIAAQTLLDNVAEAVKNFNDPDGTLIGDPDAWSDQYSAVAELLTGMTRTVREKIINKMDSSTAKSRLSNESQPKQVVSLSAAQLAHLNAQETTARTLSVNLSNADGFPFDHDLVVIESVSVRALSVRARDGSDIAPDELNSHFFTVQIGHTGRALMKTGNTLYAARSGVFEPEEVIGAGASRSSDVPIVRSWNETFDGTGTKQNKGSDDYSQELEKSVLELGEDISKLFNMLPAWTELYVHFDNDSDRFEITKMELEINFRSVPSSKTSGLHVAANDGGVYALTLDTGDGEPVQHNTPFTHFVAPGQTVSLSSADPETAQIARLVNTRIKSDTYAAEDAQVNIPIKTGQVLDLEAQIEVQQTS